MHLEKLFNEILLQLKEESRKYKQVLEPYSSFFPAVSGKLKVVVQLKSQQ